MAKSDGAVVIETRLNTDKIDSDFKKIDKQTKNMINRYNKSVDSIKSQEIALENTKKKLDALVNSEKTPASLRAMETELNKINKQFDMADKRLSRNKEVVEEKKGQKQIQQGLGNADEVAKIEKEIQSVLAENEELKTSMVSLDEKAAELESKIGKIKLNPNSSVEAQNLTQKIENMNSKLEESKRQTNELGKSIKNNLGAKAQLAGITGGLEGVGKKVDKLKTRMTRLIGTVAIFNLIRNSLTKLRNGYISLLKQNDSFSSSLNQIKANLMTAFAPIYNACLPAINSLMNALSKVTGTIAVFISGLFGTSLEDAKKQAEGLSKSLDDTAKSGEKASGSLASFDNLEVINDNSGSGGPSSKDNIDYSGEITYSQKLLDILNKISDWVSKNGDLVIAFIAGVTGALIALKTLGLDPIKSLGMGVALAGIIYTIESLIGYLKDPTFENFGKVFQGIGVAVIGVGIAVGSLPAIVVGAIILIWGTIVKYWNQIRDFFQKGIDWLSSKSDFIHQKFGDTIGNIYDFFVSKLQKGLDWADFMMKKIKDNFDEIIDFVKNVFSGNWKGAWQNVKNIFSNIWDGIKRTASDVFYGILDAAKLMAKNAGDSFANIFKGIINGILNLIENRLNTPAKAINKLIGVINKVPGINLGTLPTFKLPRLATGAVIPPRSEFMAILGDQKRGVNIETPLDTMVEAFNKALDDRGNGSGDVVIENLTIVAKMGDTEVSKTVVKGVRLAEKKFGKPLFVN